MACAIQFLDKGAILCNVEIPQTTRNLPHDYRVCHPGIEFQFVCGEHALLTSLITKDETNALFPWFLSRELSVRIE